MGCIFSFSGATEFVSVVMGPGVVLNSSMPFVGSVTELVVVVVVVVVAEATARLRFFTGVDRVVLTGCTAFDPGVLC